MDKFLNKDVIFRNLEFENSAQVISFLADKLLEAGYVKEGYKEAILERELEYPTGLPSNAPGIAIPHANHELVNTTTLGIATLKNPVSFQNMEDTKSAVEIQIVIMLAIDEPHGHIEMLQKIVGIIQDEATRKNILAAESDNQLFSLLEKSLI
ncbi:PTS sugar transporter subunit IIA [Aerococcus agrisoli]|jgi:PTS system galactitol-specific IIA component|uniref:PTS sugar transporter subunit IIA n=1 Tax=Aerococcus agrisoli TaxID=2487350 RepID=A0A3N4H728_9LACT|nr:PTS sugar transporter subunit IIA [Aerococcus agrisoli]RPA60974.1 PTS sugar transporter subunit IIA [Aerococcus agrisoli]